LHPTAAVAGTPTNVAQKIIAELEASDRGRYAGPVGWIGADGDGEWAIALRGAQISHSSGAQISHSSGAQISHSSGAQISHSSGAQIKNATLRAFAGGGIVAESEPEAELAETELKFRPIREALS
jgi:menaquinone-specific isochorismate synthase